MVRFPQASFTIVVCRDPSPGARGATLALAMYKRIEPLFGISEELTFRSQGDGFICHRDYKLWQRRKAERRGLKLKQALT